MAMNKVPTLLLGLGGIGSSIVDMTAKMLNDDMKRHVATIGMDTNIEDLKKLSIPVIQTSDERLVNDFLNEYKEHNAWFPNNEFIMNRGMLTGAGQIRAISRLAGLASDTEGRYLTLSTEINRIMEHADGKDNSQFNVFIVGSITGGTGAGLFLQMPFYLRNHLKEENSMENARIRGMFISADITKAVQPSTINRDAVMVNAYTCMKELNAFYMMQKTEEATPIQLDYYEKTDIRAKAKKIYEELCKMPINKNVDREVLRERAKNLASEGANIPYDAFYLIEGTDNGGSIGNAELDSVKAQISRILYTMLFTPVKGVEEGTLDNTILQDMEGNGMNRYSSAGLCRIKYPYETVKEYVTLRWVKDLVREEWTLLDKKYASEVKAAQDRKKQDPSLEIPPVEKKYMELFEKEAEGGEGCNLAHLNKEVFTQDEKNPDNTTTKAEDLIAAIEQHIELMVKNNTNLKNAKNQCDAVMDNLNDMDNAEGEMARIGKALDTYQKLMDKFIKDNLVQVADDVFPTTKDILNMNKKNPLSFYQMLVGVHPISGRYLCYNMLKNLEEKIEDMNRGLRGIDLLSYKNSDFDEKEPGRQTPSEAFANIKSKNIPIINPAKKNLVVLGDKVNKKAKKMAKNIEEYGVKKVKLSTYQILKERFSELAEYYGQFFNGIEEAIKINDERIQTLEKAYTFEYMGEINVYASKAAFEQIYTEYKTKASYELPQATKKAVFEGLFAITSKVLAKKDEEFTEKQKRERIQEIRDLLDEMFSKSIVENLKTIVEEKGAGTVDMTIKQAIEKQMLLEGSKEKKSIADDDSDVRERKRIAYAKNLILQGMDKATPMFTVKRKSDFTETIYVCINPKAAEYKEGTPDKGETKKRLIPAGEKQTDNKPASVLMETEFSPYEIICLKAKHKYSIEDITKYGIGSMYEKKYEERIDNLGKQPLATGADAYKTVVNPHLCHYWHEEGMIPALTPEARETSYNDCLKAFIYGLGMDLFRLSESEGRKGEYWHFMRGARWELVKSCDCLIGRTYVDLFNSIPFNRTIKNTILYNAEEMREDLAREIDIENDYRTVLDTEFIKDLTQEEVQENEDNIFDIFLTMYPLMDKSKWNDLFEGLRLVLDEYLSLLLNGNIYVMRTAYEEIIDRILQYSKVANKNGESENLTAAERKFFENIEEMKRKSLY